MLSKKAEMKRGLIADIRDDEGVREIVAELATNKWTGGKDYNPILEIVQRARSTSI